MKRVLLILVTPALIILILVGLARYWAIPKIESWALTQIKDYSHQNLPVDITGESLNFYFLKPSISLEGVKITPKPELAKILEPISVESVRAHVDLFQLLVGRFDISALVVESAKIQMNLDPLLEDKSPSKPLPLDQIFNLTEKIPLQKIYLQNISVGLHSKTEGVDAQFDSFALALSNHKPVLAAKIEVPTAQIISKEFGKFAGGLDTQLTLSRKSLKINQLRLKINSSEIGGNGELTDFKNVTLHPEGSLDLSAQLVLSDIYSELKNAKPNMKLPKFEGALKAKAQIKFKDLNNFSGSAQVQTKQVVVGEFEVGDADLRGIFKDRHINISDFVVTHPAGKASLSDAQINFGDQNNNKISYSATAHVKSMALLQLLKSLGVKTTIIDMKVEGDLPCRGEFSEGAKVSCDFNLRAKDLIMQTPPKQGKREEMLHIDALNATGKVQIDADSLNFQGKVGLGADTLATEGEVVYEGGTYKIHFKSDHVDLKNFRNIVNLKLVGEVAADGNVQGKVENFTVDTKLSAEKFSLEDYQLGNLSAQVRYAQDHLSFENIQGAVNRSQYQGGLDLDLDHKQIKGQLKLPAADLTDVAFIFEKIYKFPFNIGGPGQADINFSGPLDFWKMSYSLNSQFKNFTFGRESFDQLIFNVVSDQGDIKAQKVEARKAHSLLTLTGGITDKNMHLAAVGKNWKLEETDTINKINSNIYGTANFDMDLKGLIDQPIVTGKGAITETVIDEQEIPNSTFTAKIDRNHMESDINLFGNKINGQFVLPFKACSSPLKIKLKTTEWAFSSLLALMGGSNLANDYDSALTADIDLQSDSGEITKSTGNIHIKDLYLRRGASSFRNKQTIEVRMDRGVASIKNFDLEGPDNKIVIKGDSFTADNLNLNIIANTELRLLHMFLPFLEDVGGPVQVSAAVSGSVTAPEILGNLGLRNGFVKIKGFPHPFEKMNADVVFSHKRIVINSVKGQLAGGSLSGDGSILLNGPRDLPMNIRAHIENATFNVPDHIRSTGKGDILFSGNWFPFLLSGTFYVNHAFIDKEFVGEEGGMTTLRQSIYLPKTLKEATFEALVMDLQIVLEKNIVIKNSLMEGSVTGNLQIKGPPQNPVILGKLSTEKNSKLIFKDKIFDIQVGEIQFNNQDEINPEIYLTAQSRVNEYDISLLAQGPAKSLAGGGIHVSSIPPLPEQDIVSLLALGVTSTSQRLDQQQVTQTSKDQQSQASYEIGAAIIGAPINKRLQSTLGLNLQYSNTYDTIRNISVPKVTLSRKINNNWNASASRTIGDQQSYDIRAQYSINQNVSTILSYENKDYSDYSSLNASTQRNIQSFFGLDLEYKREFK